MAILFNKKVTSSTKRLCSRVNRLSLCRRTSYGSFDFKMNLVALRWILSSLFTFLLVNGHQTTEQYSRFDLTREQYKVFRVHSSLRSIHVLLIKPNILFALAVIISIWEFQDKPLLVNIPKSLNSLTSSRTVSLNCSSWSSFDKTMLPIWQVSWDMGINCWVHYTLLTFSWNGQKRDRSVVIHKVPFFCFMNWWNVGEFPLYRNSS